MTAPTAKHRERAGEIRITKLDDLIGPSAVPGYSCLSMLADDAIAEALAATEATAHAEGREEMREEAAKVCDEAARQEFMNQQHSATASRWMDQIAAAIRALPKDTGK